MPGVLLHAAAAAAAGTGGETLCWTTFADGLLDDRLVLGGGSVTGGEGALGFSVLFFLC